MESRKEIEFILQLPQNFRDAIKYILKVLINEVHPVIMQICNKLHSSDEVYEVIKIRDIYNLCCNQIKKSIMNLLDVLKLEYNQGIILQESRQCNVERLQWCINRLTLINIYLEKNNNLVQNVNDSADDSININVMYFVNWIDHTFDVLNKLSDAIYRTDYKDNDDIYNLWKNDMVEYVRDLNISTDELLLSAMTLCRYCLPPDQRIVKARCQVVFRETKALLSEIIEGDLDSPVKINPDMLKLPIMPSNVNILVDVLRNVLYVLENNTNTALLALLINCFSNSMSPIDVLRLHFNNSAKGACRCMEDNKDISENCSFVKEFDLYNERLIQIGTFAVSCSSDQNRTLSVRSGLASLEALDPHLVPALMMSKPDSHHSTLLINSWRQELQEIRDNVFLIVDPAAFADKSMQMLRQRLMDVLKLNVYNNTDVCSVINIGCVIYDFFDVYDRYEPDALMHREKMSPLLTDLKKVQNECKIVSNLLSSTDNFHYDVKTPHNKRVSFDQLTKRLKLLYTVVKRINTILNPNENDDQLLEAACDDDDEKHYVTHTIYKSDDKINSLENPNNVSRTFFARTINIIRSSAKKLPLAKLTKNLQAKRNDEISFSVQLDKLFNTTNHDSKTEVKNETILLKDRLIREPSILYFTPAKRSSMRKIVLNRHCISNDKLDETRNICGETEEERKLDSDSFMEDTSLQITDVLNQINDLTSILSTNKISRRHDQTQGKDNKQTKNILSININNEATAISKHVWNIPVNNSLLNESEFASNMSTPSNVTTMERIYDLKLVESKLNDLKSQLETSL